MSRTGTGNGDTRYSLADLTDRAGVSVRTVRYYIAEGLLPPPLGSGPASFYTQAHLDRLRLIGKLKDAYLPLKEIRKRLDGVEDAELPGLLALSDPELFDPATWENLGGPRTVTSYLDRAARESRSGGSMRSAPRASRGPIAWRSPSAPVRGNEVLADASFGDFFADLDDEVEEVAEVRQKAEPDVLNWSVADERPASMMPPAARARASAKLADVSSERPEIDREAGPAWRRVALGEEIELMVSDRAWRRNREKLEWLANWAKKVLR